MRRVFITDWLALCEVRFWDRAEAIVLLEQERTERGVSLVVVMDGAAGAEEIERASSIASSNSKPTL